MTQKINAENLLNVVVADQLKDLLDSFLAKQEILEDFCRRLETITVSISEETRLIIYINIYCINTYKLYKQTHSILLV